MSNPDLTPEGIELLPCPFCGCTDIMLFCDEEEACDNSGPSRRAQCGRCHIEAPFYETKGLAVAVWNTRATPPAPQETAGEAVARPKCQGNGEIVTDWDAYITGSDDERSTAECPDCSGTGYVRAHPTPTPAPTDNAALVEALRPFAEAADIKLCGEWRDDDSIQRTDVAFHVTFGHLRAARAALASRPAEATSRERVK